MDRDRLVKVLSGAHTVLGEGFISLVDAVHIAAMRELSWSTHREINAFATNVLDYVGREPGDEAILEDKEDLYARIESALERESRGE